MEGEDQYPNPTTAVPETLLDVQPHAIDDPDRQTLNTWFGGQTKLKPQPTTVHRLPSEGGEATLVQHDHEQDYSVELPSKHQLNE